MSTARTAVRALTETEREQLARLRVEITSPIQADELLRELIVARSTLATVRRVRRCLPHAANAALDDLPHAVHTFTPFRSDAD